MELAKHCRFVKSAAFENHAPNIGYNVVHVFQIHISFFAERPTNLMDDLRIMTLLKVLPSPLYTFGDSTLQNRIAIFCLCTDFHTMRIHSY